MFGFIKKNKNNYNRETCRQALANAQAISEEIDNASNYENFKYHVSQLKYHSTNARKYFDKIEWDHATHEILVDSDIKKIEEQVIELSHISEEDYKDLMSDD